MNLRTFLLTKSTHPAAAVVVAFCLGGSVQGATLNENTTTNDSTQPRGTVLAAPGLNTAGQDLSPLIHGFLGPQYRADVGGSGEFFDWSGNIMANATRDPSFYSTLNAANRDFINYINGLFRSSVTADQDQGAKLLNALGLDGVLEFKFDPAVGRAQGQIVTKAGQDPVAFAPDKLLPMTGDFCLRCHSPGGWLEGQSEPAHPGFDFLKGQLWGAAFTEYPGHEPAAPGPYYTGTPRQVDIFKEPHTGMEGVSCDLCHRATDNFKRVSNQPPYPALPNGNGGFFVARRDPHNFGGIDASRPSEDFLNSSMLCGTCHDVTNPILEVDKDYLSDISSVISGMPQTMLQPIERTFTEWYWSAFRREGKDCQGCHSPMSFQGAQTWMLYPGLDSLWGDVDQIWTDVFGFSGVSRDRSLAYLTSATKNREFMRSAASVQIIRTVREGDMLKVTVRVINNTGHKLPTGFGEGRQMWVHFKAVNSANSSVLYEDGVLNSAGILRANGDLPRENVRALYQFHGKVSEHTKGLKKANGNSILDADDLNGLTPDEEEFHFVLFTKVEDNRIPPRGWVKDAYFRDGAFVYAENYVKNGLPVHPTARYAPGQYWDDTTYEIPLNGFRGKVNVTATLRYQTFNREYVDHLLATDKEPTVLNGGQARKIPDAFAHNQHWSQVVDQIWTGAEKGKPVDMTSARRGVEAK